MRPAVDLVASVLRDPVSVRAYDLARWDLLVRQARASDLLVRLAHVFERRGLMDCVPAPVHAHLAASHTVARRQADEARREVRAVQKALTPIGIPLTLLKGAAYLMAGLPPGAARVFSDVDILVPKSELAGVEAVLMSEGWATSHHDTYDQHYYRAWMHELPPLQHVRRMTVLDVHHAILPDTARLKPSSAKLLAAATPLPGQPGLMVLAPADMVLHSITHLFHNDELSHALRDLSDIDLLLLHFGAESGFWDGLVRRAAELDLARPLYYGLRFSERILGTPVPSSVQAAAAVAAPAQAALMDALWLRALRPPHALAADFWTPAALFVLYVRAHWLRMPPWLLLRHLSVKAWRRRFKADEGLA